MPSEEEKPSDGPVPFVLSLSKDAKRSIQLRSAVLTPATAVATPCRPQVQGEKSPRPSGAKVREKVDSLSCSSMGAFRL